DLAPRVTSLAADEGSMQQKLDELMDLCTSLQKQHSEIVSRFEAQELEINSLKAIIKLLEDKDRGVADQSRDDAPIKGRWLDEGEEAAERVIPTGSGSIPTTGAPATRVPTGSDVVPTAGLIFAAATVVTPYTKRNGKEKMIESGTPKKKKIQEKMDIQMARQLEEEMERDAQRMNEQISRDAEIASIHAEEELQMLIRSLDKSNETVVKYLQEYEYIPEDLSIGQRIELIIWKQIEDFIPMGSKEETERFKRKGLRLEQVSEKKLKTSKEVSEEVKAIEDVPEDMVQEMMQLVPVEEVYVEALQIKHPIIDCCGVPTARSSSHCQKKIDATAEKIALLWNSSSNCQSKSYDSYAKGGHFARKCRSPRDNRNKEAIRRAVPVESFQAEEEPINYALMAFTSPGSSSSSGLDNELENEDLKQIDPDDLEKMDLKWQMAMLTMRARRFLKKTKRNLEEAILPGNADHLGTTETKKLLEELSQWRGGHFARKCRSPRDNRNKEAIRRAVPVEVSTLNALVSECDVVHG
nr:hypothetical protein [Tanacetum cinerariifolium]